MEISIKFFAGLMISLLVILANDTRIMKIENLRKYEKSKIETI